MPWKLLCMPESGSLTASKVLALRYLLMTANNKLCERDICKHLHPPSDSRKTWAGLAITAERVCPSPYSFVTAYYSATCMISWNQIWRKFWEYLWRMHMWNISISIYWLVSSFEGTLETSSKAVQSVVTCCLDRHPEFHPQETHGGKRESTLQRILLSPHLCNDMHICIPLHTSPYIYIDKYVHAYMHRIRKMF